MILRYEIMNKNNLNIFMIFIIFNYESLITFQKFNEFI